MSEASVRSHIIRAARRSVMTLSRHKVTDQIGETTNDTRQNGSTPKRRPHTAGSISARGKATRRRILVAAEWEFSNRGYHASSIKSITLRACASVGTFYLYFPGKDDALKALVRELAAKLKRQFERAGQVRRTQPQFSQVPLQVYVEFLTQHPGLDGIVSVLALVDQELFREYHEVVSHGLQLEWEQTAFPATDKPRTDSVGAGLWIHRFVRLWEQVQRTRQTNSLDRE